MLKPHIALAIIATLCYAVSGVITERYSPKLHVLWMLVLNNASMIVITAISIVAVRLIDRQPEMKMTWSTFAAVSLVAGAILFGANYAFYQAFREGGTLPEIATILCLLPIFSSLLRMPFGPEGEQSYVLPSWQVMVGATLIIVGILFISFQSKPPSP